MEREDAIKELPMRKWRDSTPKSNGVSQY